MPTVGWREDSNICGLVGMAGNLTIKHDKVLKDLLVMDSLRGQHSVGVAAIGLGSAEIFKRAVLPADFFTMKGFNAIMKWNNSVYIGHNRYATQGKINSVNAHPFEHGNIVGAHNGTLRQQNLLPDHKDFEVDSENIIHSINKLGIKETHTKLNGAFALTYFDFEEDRLCMIRNNERPLYYTTGEDGDTLFWASEAWMLRAALNRNGFKHNDVRDVTVGVHHSFDVDVKAKEPIMVTRTSMKGYVAPRVVAKSNSTPYSADYKTGNVIQFRMDSWKQAVGTSNIEGSQIGKSNICVKSYSVPASIRQAFLDKDSGVFEGEIQSTYMTGPNGGSRTVILRPASIKRHVSKVTENKVGTTSKKSTITVGGREITKERFNLATGNMCSWCTDDVQFEDAGVVVFQDLQGCVCKSCAELDDVKDYLIN